MKHVLVIGSKLASRKNNPIDIAQQLSLEGVEVRVTYWEDLVFNIETNEVSVISDGRSILAESPELVITVGWYKNGKHSLYRDVAYSIALFLESNGIPYWNSEMGTQRSISKLSTMMLLALNNVSIPKTYFSLSLDNILGITAMPYIAKAAAASRGESNFLISSDADIEKLRSADAFFIVQPFVENDHDLRIICFNGVPSLVLKRARAKDADTHLNNTSQGAQATWLGLSEVDSRILTLSEKICKITNREMAGIDFIADASSDLGYSCLEVNAVPQLTSGTDSDKKLKTFAQAVRAIGE
jgi:glutathione synthase/RimK-type ligase-like ATP-grasp enzyme